jgi:hypothetical protein
MAMKVGNRSGCRGLTDTGQGKSWDIVQISSDIVGVLTVCNVSQNWATSGEIDVLMDFAGKIEQRN